MNKFTNEEKEKFLILYGWEKIQGFLVNTPPASNDCDYTFVSSEDMLESLKKGEKNYYSAEEHGYENIYDLEEAFDYAYDDFYEEEQERLDSDELTEEQIDQNIKALLEFDNFTKKTNLTKTPSKDK